MEERNRGVVVERTRAAEDQTELRERAHLGVDSFGGFDAACRTVLMQLRSEFGLGVWFVARKVGEEYILLNVDGDGVELAEGAVMDWSDSVCSRMVDRGAAVATDLPTDPVLAGSPAAEQLSLLSYLGVSLLTPDGELFGTLGAVSTDHQPESLRDALPQVELLGGLLMTVLDAELRVEAEQRRAEREWDAARTDALCGISNRRAWDDAVDREEARCRRYGAPAGIVMVDLDRLKSVNDDHGHAAGDVLLRRAARVLGSVVRDTDLVARLGGDEFGVLVPGATSEDLEVLVERIAEALQAAEVLASVGAMSRRADMTLRDTWHGADREMYRNKADAASTKRSLDG